MTSTITKQRNCSIDIFRYICAIMVVMIHTNPLAEFSYGLNYIAVNIFPRIAVPFFFAVAGYFYISKIETTGSTNHFSNYIKRLLTTYGIWSVVYISVDFIQWGRTSPEDFIKDVLWGIPLKGTYYHFWFFPALIISVCIVTVIFKAKLKKLLLPLSLVLCFTGIFCSSYYNAIKDIPVFGEFIKTVSPAFNILFYGFPFFVSGYLVFKIKDRVSQKLSHKAFIGLLIAIVFLWIAEILLTTKLNLNNNLLLNFSFYPLVVTVVIFLLRYPLTKHCKLASLCKTLANFTYYSHPLFLTCCINLLKSLFGIEISPTPLFLIAVCITFTLGAIIHKIDNKHLNIIVN